MNSWRDQEFVAPHVGAAQPSTEQTSAQRGIYSEDFIATRDLKRVYTIE